MGWAAGPWQTQNLSMSEMAILRFFNSQRLRRYSNSYRIRNIETITPSKMDIANMVIVTAFTVELPSGYGKGIVNRDFKRVFLRSTVREYRPGRTPWRNIHCNAARAECALCLLPLKGNLPIQFFIEQGARMPRHYSLFLILLPLALAITLSAQSKPEAPEYDVKEHYTKYEYRISMRDGMHLFTSVYVPKDTARAYPFLINRTPYSVGPYGVDLYRRSLGPSPDFDKAGYIDNKKSRQDVDDASDLYDTIDWLLKNVPNNNGNAGIWGISYPGFFAAASIIDSHPALKAASPQAPMIDLFMGDDAYHGGAFMLDANFGFYTFFKPQENPQLPAKTFVPFDYGTKDDYEFYLNAGPIGNLSKYLEGKSALFDDQMRHDTYDGYWKARNLAPHMKNIHCAVLTGGMVRRRRSAGAVQHVPRD
jgi:hypothetical protein